MVPMQPFPFRFVQQLNCTCRGDGVPRREAFYVGSLCGFFLSRLIQVINAGKIFRVRYCVYLVRENF